MYLNPIFSLLILGVVIALYFFVIRPRLKVAFSETYLHIDGFWSRLLARLYAFRSYAATLGAAVAIALPDILVSFTSLDFSAFLPANWAGIVSSLLAAYLALNRAFSTKPRDEPA